MLPDRERRIQKLNNPSERWDNRSNVPKIKLGDTTDTYIAADTGNFIKAKTEAVGFDYTPNGTVINPGISLRHALEYTRVSYGELSFHPSAGRQPSTAVFPYPTFIPSIVDPDSKVLANLVETLQGLAGLIGLR